MTAVLEARPIQRGVGGDPVRNPATDGPFLDQPLRTKEPPDRLLGQPRVATFGRRATLDIMIQPVDPTVLTETGLTIAPGEKQAHTLVKTSAGGNEVNTGLDLARQGVETTIYTVAGDDPNGDAIEGELLRATKEPNTRLTVDIRRQGDSRVSTIISNPGEDRRVMSASPGDKTADTGVHFEELKGKVDEHDYFYFTYMGQGFSDVVQEVKDKKKRYSMSLNSVDFAELGDHHFEAINGADILFTNVEEAAKITAAAPNLPFDEAHFSGLYETMTEENKGLIDKNTFLLLHKVKALGVTWGSVTDGGNGSYLIDETSTILHIAPFNQHLPEDQRTFVNSLGAGDAYASGLIAARARGQGAEEAMRQGAIMSDKTIKVVGPHDGPTSAEDMEYTSWRFLKDFRPSILFEKPHIIETFIYEYVGKPVTQTDRKDRNIYPFS